MKLDDLFTFLETRKKEAPEGSYTARLLTAGEDEILKKVYYKNALKIVPGLDKSLFPE